MRTEPKNDILRFATAGSVDDGKSSLIGRLLFDSKAILEDQLRAIEHASKQRGAEQLELALLTDGLRAEREQNITIDVAYRFFTTPRRKFIIADTPGHLQYTRNMVTGTSTADLSVVLIDARKGVLTQSKRHAAISSLLGLPHLVVAVNKMDLVDFSLDVFRKIEHEFRAFTDRLGVPHVTFIPISALLGDNVVEASDHTPWYVGPTLLDFLETVQVPVRAKTAFRMPVQVVVRPHQDFRGFAGRVEGGSLKLGDLVVVASSGQSSRVQTIHIGDKEAESAEVGQPVVLSLEHEIDISRGDMLVAPLDRPASSDRFEAIICWLQESTLEVGRRYFLMHTTRRLTAVVETIVHRIDVDTLNPLASTSLGVNDIGRVAIRTSSPLFFDPYSVNPSTGSFVLVDPGTNVTVAAGMIQAARVESVESDRLLEGKIVWLDPWSDQGAFLAEKLRDFGLRTILLQGSDFESFGDPIEGLSRVALNMAQQGFNVLVSLSLRDHERSDWSGPGLLLSKLRNGKVSGNTDRDTNLEVLLSSFSTT